MTPRLNKFECDKNKARINFQKHGIKFTEGSRIFDGHVLTAPSYLNSNLTENRFVSIGALENRKAVVVIWTKRIECIRVISVRAARTKEKDQYNAYIEKKIN